MENKIKDLERQLSICSNKIAVLEADEAKYLKKLKEFGIELTEEAIRAEFAKVTREISSYEERINEIINSVNEEMGV